MTAFLDQMPRIAPQSMLRLQSVEQVQVLGLAVVQVVDCFEPVQLGFAQLHLDHLAPVHLELDCRCS